MSEHSEPRSGRGGLSWRTVVLLGPLLYLLSVGPAILLLRHHPGFEKTFEQVYAPVIWLHDHTALKVPLELYAGLWK